MNFNVNLNTTKVDTTSDINNANIDSLNKANNGNQIDSTVLPNVKKDSTVPFESSAMPSLDTPTSSVSSSTYSTALSALGEILVLLNKVNSEQVAQNRQLQYENLMACAENLEKQADEMKSGALKALICKVVAGSISIAMGLVSTIKAASNYRTYARGMGNIENGGKEAIENAFKTATDKLTYVNQFVQGVAKIVEGTGDYLSTVSNAEVKKLESQGEKMKASNESLKAVTEKLEETIKKAMDVFQSLSQGQIELTKRING